MTELDLSARIDVAQPKSHRLVNSKYPPISLFDDVADADEFEALYALQALTNPRLQNEIGNLHLVPRSEIPFGIPGCAYAVAPFTHVNPDGSRFSDGQFGVLYLADSTETAIKEVSYHQNRYWQAVAGLRFDRFVFRSLTCGFAAGNVYNACTRPLNDPIYHADDYSSARRLGAQLRTERATAIQYHSVRNTGAICWALLTPAPVSSIVQAAHYEFIWNGRITSVNLLRAFH